MHLSKKQGAASLLLVQLLLLLLHLAMSYTGDLAREPPRPPSPLKELATGPNKPRKICEMKWRV